MIITKQHVTAFYSEIKPSLFWSSMNLPNKTAIFTLHIDYVVAFNLGYAKTSYINQNETQEPLEPSTSSDTLRIEVLACQKQAQSSH
jgi:hypothetical protein